MEKQDDEKTSAEYLTGFNQGYELAQKLPDLAEKLMAALQGRDDDRAKGMQDGHREMLMEHTRERLADRGNSRETSTPQKEASKGDDMAPDR